MIIIITDNFYPDTKRTKPWVLVYQNKYKYYMTAKATVECLVRHRAARHTRRIVLMQLLYTATQTKLENAFYQFD